VAKGNEPAATGPVVANDHKPTTGEFLAPEDGQQLDSPEIQAVVRIENAKPERYYWVSEKIGNLHWPKGFVTKSGLDKRNRATVMIYKGDSWDSFELTLLEVEEESHLKFKAWLENGKRTGSYPGIVYPPADATVLDTVKVERKQ
jgi:hypothetical protein